MQLQPNCATTKIHNRLGGAESAPIWSSAEILWSQCHWEGALWSLTCATQSAGGTAPLPMGRATATGKPESAVVTAFQARLNLLGRSNGSNSSTRASVA